jgi:hypothetical protein
LELRSIGLVRKTQLEIDAGQRAQRFIELTERYPSLTWESDFSTLEAVIHLRDGFCLRESLDEFPSHQLIAQLILVMR